jgi:hypothetical protein
VGLFSSYFFFFLIVGFHCSFLWGIYECLHQEQAEVLCIVCSYPSCHSRPLGPPPVLPSPVHVPIILIHFSLSPFNGTLPVRVAPIIIAVIATVHVPVLIMSCRILQVLLYMLPYWITRRTTRYQIPYIYSYKGEESPVPVPAVFRVKCKLSLVHTNETWQHTSTQERKQTLPGRCLETFQPRHSDLVCPTVGPSSIESPLHRPSLTFIGFFLFFFFLLFHS